MYKGADSRPKVEVVQAACKKLNFTAAVYLVDFGKWVRNDQLALKTHRHVSALAKDTSEILPQFSRLDLAFTFHHHSRVQLNCKRVLKA